LIVHHNPGAFAVNAVSRQFVKRFSVTLTSSPYLVTCISSLPRPNACPFDLDQRSVKLGALRSLRIDAAWYSLTLEPLRFVCPCFPARDAVIGPGSGFGQHCGARHSPEFAAAVRGGGRGSPVEWRRYRRKSPQLDPYAGTNPPAHVARSDEMRPQQCGDPVKPRDIRGASRFWGSPACVRADCPVGDESWRRTSRSSSPAPRHHCLVTSSALSRQFVQHPGVVRCRAWRPILNQMRGSTSTPTRSML
jgi:hypothetical protein